MVRYTGPKNRIARRFGANIFGYARNPLLHKPNPPGMHGARRKKKSDFGMQLDEQQKLKAIYGMLPQKQLVRAYNVASRSKGNTLLVFMQQLVSHGHVLVDGKKVDRRSFLVEPEMTVSLKPQIQKLDWAKQAQASAAREIPEYLSAEEGKFSGKLLVRPETDQIPLPLPVNIALVCDFLAHIS